MTIYQKGYQHLYNFSRINNAGDNTRPHQKFQLPGLENDPEVQAIFQQHGCTNMLSQLAAAQRQAYAGKSHNPASSHAQFESSETLIQDLVKKCRNVPLFPGEKSGYKDLHTTCARVCLGELLCEVFLQSDASDIGCSPEMFKAGQKYIEERNKTVNSRAAHSSSKGSAYGEALGRHKRPNLTDFLRCGLAAMCKQADSWRDQASFTNFVAVFVFSILKGVDCAYLDQLNLSESELVSSKIERGKSAGKAKTDEDGAATAGTHVPADVDDFDALASSGKNGSISKEKEGVKNKAKKAVVKKDKKANWPGGRRLFKELNDDKISEIFIQCLKILVAGHFELLPSASVSEFEQTKLRPSNTEMRESLMMDNIFKFVSQRLSEERKDDPGSSDRVWSGKNFWTDSENASSVAEFFSDQKPRKQWVEEQRKGCRRIIVDPVRCGRALGFCTQNMLHFLEKNAKVLNQKMTDEGHSEDEILEAVKEADEHVETVRGCVKPIVDFVCSLPSPGNLGIRTLQLPKVTSKGPSKKRISRKNDSSPGAQPLPSVSSSGVDQTSDSVLIGEEHRRIRLRAQMSVGKPLRLPDPNECATFARNLCALPDAGSFVVLVERLCCADETQVSSFSDHVSSATLFAVFSSEETSLGKVPLVVFPCVGAEKSDKVQYTLGSPGFFNQRRPCRESWAFFTATAVKDHKRVNSEEGVFWFLNELVKQQVVSVLQSDGMVRKWKQCLSYERLFRGDNVGPPHDETTWMIETDAAGARADVFTKGFMQAQMLVQLAVAVNSQELQLGTWPMEQESVVLRERFGDRRGKNLNLVLKSVEPTEAPLAFCVELLNVPSLRTIMLVDLSERPSCVSVCAVVLEKGSGEMSDVKFYVPSWDSGFRCTVHGSFIVLILEKEDVEQKCHLLTLVPRIEARSEGMQKQMHCSSVIQGTLLSRNLPLLWEKMTSTSVSIRRFSSWQLPMAPSGFVGDYLKEKMDLKEKKHLSTHAWSLGQELTWLRVPGDGNCWITAMCVSAGISPWWPDESGWVDVNAPVVNMVRRCVASVLVTIQEEYKKTYGDKIDVASMLFSETCSQVRWRNILAGKIDRFNPLVPGNYGGEPEMAVLAWLFQVNFNVLTRPGKETSVDDLSNHVVRVLHFDRSAQALLTLTGRMPPLQEPSCFDGKCLSEFRDVARFTVQLDKKKPPRFYEIFAFVFSPRNCDLPYENLSVVIAKQLLETKFCETGGMSSAFIVHNGKMDAESHFDAIMSCREKPLRLPPAERLNVITHRLNFGATRVVGHLLEVALGIYLEDKERGLGESLLAVHCCKDNETVMEVAEFFKQTYKLELCADDIYKANIEVLGQPPAATRSNASGNSGKAPRKVIDRCQRGLRLLVPLTKECFREGLKGVGAMSELSDTKKKHFHSAMTMVCHQGGLEAKRTHHDARVHVFGCLDTVRADEGVVIHSHQDEGAKKKADPSKALLLAYYTLQKPTTDKLVELLCVSSTEALPFVRLCNLMRTVDKEFREMTAPRHELWLAAEHAQDVEKLKKTHPELKQPIKGMVVPASEEECSGTGSAREIRKRDFRLPYLFLFISLIAGYGVYPLEILGSGTFLTEYGGVLVTQQEGDELEKRGEATHIRKIDRHHLALDGRLKLPCGMSYFALNHQVFLE